MNANMLRAVVFLSLALAPSAFGQDLLEKVVVRNRLHTVGGNFEVSPSLGLTLVNRLTRHYNAQLGVGYNFNENWALELRGGYAVSGHTGLAKDAAAALLSLDPASQARTRSDLSNLWTMKANGVLGVRWAPIYGKISLLAELPVHFQTYVWLGGGAAQLEQQSIVYCRNVGNRPAGICGQVQAGAGGLPELVPGTEAYRTDTKNSWVGSAAVGFRFFTGNVGAINLELRNYVYPDAYLQNVDRTVAEAGGETGTPAPSPGLINLVLFDLGYTFFF